MKILIVNKFLYPNGGSETYIFALGKELERLGNEVQYFGMEHEGRIVGNHANSYTEDMDFHSGFANKFSYPIKIVYSRDSRKKIRAVLEDFHPEVVHLNNINFQITPSIIDEIKEFDSSIRIVYTAHDYQWVCPNHMLKKGADDTLCSVECLRTNYVSCIKNRCIHGSRMRSVLGAFEGRYYSKKKTYELVDKIICPSHFMERMLIQNPILAGKTVTVHNFLTIDKQIFIKEDDCTKTIIDNKGRKLPARYALYFGRFDKEKGIHILMDAIRHLSNIPFVLVGKNAENVFSSLPDNVYTMPFLTGQSLKAVIQKAEFTIHPSIWYENCPFAVMESETYGTPVIASKIGGIPELILEKQTGELVSAGDVNALVNAILKLWDHPEIVEEYRSNCVDFALSQFLSLEEYTKKILTIYKG